MKLNRVFGAIVAFLCLQLAISAQGMDFQKDRYKSMLEVIKNDVKSNYYDPTFKRIDIEAKYKEAVAKMNNAASLGQLNGILAQFLIDFDDSHLFFAPPGRSNKIEYGFEMDMVGSACFISYVNDKSDAAKKGLQVGDEVLGFEGFVPTRSNLWKMRYAFYSLRPQPDLQLVIRKPDGKEAEYLVEAKLTIGKRLMDLTGQDRNVVMRESEDAYRRQQKQYYYDKLEGIFIWKMPSFSLEPDRVDGIMGKMKKGDALILDLRGNSGGRVDMMLRLVGNVFAQDVKVYDEKRRKGTKEIIAKSRGKDAFSGKLVILIDSGSASASEVFSKVVQLEKRGQIMGDQSAGAVMESQFFEETSGIDTIIFYGASVTIADLIMKDGKSLEKVGVTPDLLLLPTAKDMAEKRDPVLSRAIESMGGKMTPEAAGKLFPEDEK
jgi:C-terminal processing protease CtpA/Prc